MQRLAVEDPQLVTLAPTLSVQGWSEGGAFLNLAKLKSRRAHDFLKPEALNPKHAALKHPNSGRVEVYARGFRAGAWTLPR